MLCCCFVAECRLVQFDSCDQQAFSEGLSPHRNAEEFALPEFLECKHVGAVQLMFSKLNKFFQNLVESFWFLLVLWTSCNELFNTFLVSGDVCDEVVFHSSMFKSPAFLSKLTSITMYKSLRGVNASVFFLMCSLKASPSSVPLGKQLVNEAVDPAELRSRETENGDVDLISRSRDADDGVWFGLEEALDRTLSAMGSRTVCRKAMQNIGGQFNSNDVVNEVFLRRVNVSALPLLKTSYPQLESYFKRSDVQFCVKECAKGVPDRMQKATGMCRYFLFSSLLSSIVEIKSLLVAYECHMAFWTLIVILTRSKRTPTHTGSRRRSSELRFGLR